mmetsp:Transcript_36174/g.79517  ORF Transcript_36174/g.79517 Transcript_36174/m.79517 type:complete len:219 (-) Transcript_36174:101-757(-)
MHRLALGRAARQAPRTACHLRRREDEGLWHQPRSATNVHPNALCDLALGRLPSRQAARARRAACAAPVLAQQGRRRPGNGRGVLAGVRVVPPPLSERGRHVRERHHKDDDPLSQVRPKLRRRRRGDGGRRRRRGGGHGRQRRRRRVLGRRRRFVEGASRGRQGSLCDHREPAAPPRRPRPRDRARAHLQIQGARGEREDGRVRHIQRAARAGWRGAAA